MRAGCSRRRAAEFTGCPSAMHRQLYWKILGLCAPQDAVNVRGRSPPHFARQGGSPKSKGYPLRTNRRTLNDIIRRTLQLDRPMSVNDQKRVVDVGPPSNSITAGFVFIVHVIYRGSTGSRIEVSKDQT